MDSDSIARLLYLVVLGAAIGGALLVSGRQNMGKTARDMAIWGLIFLGVIAAYGLWDDVSRDINPRQAISQDTGEISVPQSPDGHYYLTLDINDQPIRFVVDTGATEMVLSVPDARRAGIDVDGLAFLGRANTANGPVSTAAVRLDSVVLGPVADRNVPAAVNGGEMEGSLLGMRYLDRFAALEIANGRLILRP